MCDKITEAEVDRLNIDLRNRVEALHEVLQDVQARLRTGSGGAGRVIYLAGAISGVTVEEATKWRQTAGDILMAAGYGVFNPTDDKDLTHPAANTELYTAEAIVETDLAMIQRSDIILAEASRTDVPYWGTAMEIRYAYEHGKQIVVWGAKKPSYWLQYHATRIFETLDGALGFIVQVWPCLKERR